MAEGVNNTDAVNKNKMVHYIENGALDIQGTINIRRGAISIDEINSQISAADLNKLYESNSNNISSGKIPVYGDFGSLYWDRVKFRYSTNTVYLKPSRQSGNATLLIPNLGGNNQIVALRSYVDRYRQKKFTGFLKKGESDIIFGASRWIYFESYFYVVDVKSHLYGGKR